MLLSGAAVGAVAGYFIGRRKSNTRAIKKALQGNQAWLTPKEASTVQALLDHGQGHLFSNWPPPGVRDQDKRNFLAAVSAKLESVSFADMPQGLIQPPRAAKKPKQLLHHEDTREDPYYWLRDDARKNPAVLEHLARENAHTKAVLSDTEQLQEELYREMRGRIQEADQSVPTRYHGYFYYTRTEEGQQYKSHCRRLVPSTAGPATERDALDPQQPEEVLLDENKRKEEGGHDFYMVGDLDPSPNHRLLAWSEDTVGGEKYTIHVKALDAGTEVTPPIPGTSGDLVWANDNQTLFYVVKDKLDRPYKVLRHVIGSPPGSDVVVYEEKDESFYVGIGKSRSEALLFIHAGSAVTSETRFLSADDPTGEWRLVAPRVQDVEYSVSHRGEHLYIVLRDQQRPNSELRVAPMSAPARQEVLLPHRSDVKLESISLSEQYLVAFERAGGLQRATVYALPPDGAAPTAAGLDGQGEELVFDEPAYSLGPGSQGDFSSPVLRLSYSSLTTPASTIDHNMATRGRVTKKVQPVLGGFKKEAYVTERLWAVAPDGVRVPISIVYRKGAVKLDGTDPLLLNGYGSYEISNDPYFSANRLCLLDRGWVFAIGHIRGGGEMGRDWYEDGKYLKKKNSFTDFIACAEHLIERKYTSPKCLYIEGRSAGGLLMGATVNMAPHLFNGVIAGVPFVDVLTTILDETIPLTVIEWEEWGCPKDKQYYDYIKSYSPVDNVKPQKYPNMLVTAGLHDPRVGYWEPAKFVARVRDALDAAATSGGDNGDAADDAAAAAAGVAQPLVLFKCELGAGHFSVTGRFERLKEVAIEYAFLLKCQGMVKPSKAESVVAALGGGDASKPAA